MTIAIGIRCEDGVILACDSQAEFGRGVAVKRLNANKIYKVNKTSAIVGAGITSHIEKAVDTIKFALNEEARKKGAELSKEEYVDTIETAMTALHKTYNITRSEYLGRREEEDFFNPILIFTGQSQEETGKEEKEREYCLFIIHYNGMVESIDDYGTVGSGAAYAELLLKNYYLEGIKVNEAIPIAVYVINEVKEIDPNCGGPTRLGALDAEGFTEHKQLEATEVSEEFKQVQRSLDIIRKELVPKVLRREINEKTIKGILG